jgi:hypothetical protein
VDRKEILGSVFEVFFNCNVELTSTFSLGARNLYQKLLRIK